jgi:hypothetical protein
VPVRDPAEIASLNEDFVWHRIPAQDKRRFGHPLDVLQAGDNFVFLDLATGATYGEHSGHELALQAAAGKGLKWGQPGDTVFVRAKYLKGFVVRLGLAGQIPPGNRSRLSPLGA